MKMLNGNIKCSTLDVGVKKVGGIIVPTKDLNYKRLQIESFDSQDCSPKLVVGDEVFVLKNSGVNVPMDDEDFVIIKEMDILFINK